MISTVAATAMPKPTITDTHTGKIISEDALLEHLALATVVFLGEEHTDPATHAFELRILNGLHHRAGKRLALGMEMWERDTQPALDAYLQGKTGEATFLKAARPWSNYQTDYRPLVEYAKANKITVIASNVPQAIASAVGKRGLAALTDALTDAPPGQAAALIQAPQDGAWRRFQSVMKSMGSAHGGMSLDEPTIQRFYEAQVVRDETMAESITDQLDAAPNCLLLHINGQFHSDYGDGIPRRVLWRRPLTKIIILSVIPLADKTPPPQPDQTLADYIVLVSAAPTKP